MPSASAFYFWFMSFLPWTTLLFWSLYLDAIQVNYRSHFTLKSGARLHYILTMRLSFIHSGPWIFYGQADSPFFFQPWLQSPPTFPAPAVSLLSSSLTTFSSFFVTRSQFCLHWKNTLGLPDDMDDLPLELLLSHWLSASHVTKIQYCTWAYSVCKEIRNFFSSKVFYFKPSRQSQIAHNTHDKLTASVTLLSECPPASLISHLLTLWYCCVYDWWTTVTGKSIFIF